eukprot:5624547-Prymnesium_polylepis.1
MSLIHALPIWYLPDLEVGRPRPSRSVVATTQSHSSLVNSADCVTKICSSPSNAVGKSFDGTGPIEYDVNAGTSKGAAGPQKKLWHDRAHSTS